MQHTPHWKQKAQQELKDFLVSSTRIAPRNIDISAAQDQDVHFQVEVTHTLHCDSTTETLGGRVAPSEDILVVQDEAQFYSLLPEMCSEALALEDVAEQLQLIVEENGYGKFREPYFTGAYHRSLVRTYACGGCAGAGKVACKSCRGTGEDTCVYCAGSGISDDKTYNPSSNSYSRQDSVCTGCGGSGRTVCSSCSGKGARTCGTCKGHGELSDKATFQYYVSPEYRLADLPAENRDAEFALANTDLDALEKDNVATRTSRQVLPTANPLTAKEVAVFRAPLMSANVTVNAHTSRMVIFGLDCRVADAGGLIQSLVAPDLSELQLRLDKLDESGMANTLPMQLAAFKFMRSEVHQTLVENGAAWDEVEDYVVLSDQVARAITPDGVRASLEAIEHACAAVYCGWYKIGAIAWVLLSLLGGIPLLLSGEYWLALGWVAAVLVSGLILIKAVIWLNLVLLGGLRLARFWKRRLPPHKVMKEHLKDAK